MWPPPLLKNISSHHPGDKESSIIIFSAGEEGGEGLAGGKETKACLLPNSLD